MKGKAGKEDQGGWNVKSRGDMIGYSLCKSGEKCFFAGASQPIGTTTSEISSAISP